MEGAGGEGCCGAGAAAGRTEVTGGLNECAYESALKSICHGLQCPKKHLDIILGSGAGKTRLIATTLLAISKNMKAIVCVPTIQDAKELVEEMKIFNQETRKIEDILVLSKEDMLKTTLRLNVDSIAIVYSNASLFWSHFLREVRDPQELQETLRVPSEEKGKAVPHDMFSGIHNSDITLLIEQLEHLHAYLTETNVDNDALNFVLNVTPPPNNKSRQFDEGVTEAVKLKEEMDLCLKTIEIIQSSLELKKFRTRDEVKQYLLSKSRIVICTVSSCSSLKDTICSQLNQPIDLLLIDSASDISNDLLATVCLPGVRNIVLAGDTISQQSIHCKESTFTCTKIHQLTKQFQTKGKSEVLVDAKLQKLLTPFTWLGVPEHLLAPMRDQGNTDTCTFHSLLAATETLYRLEAAADEPQRKFTINLCVEDMEERYIDLTGNELGCETSNSKKGAHRLENGLMILKKHGVLGRGRSDERVPVAFRVSSYKKYAIQDFKTICKLLKEQNVMVGYFRLSRNYFTTLNPRQEYNYNAEEPIINPNNKLARSHAIMIVGVIIDESPEQEKLTESEDKGMECSKLVYQNSYGKLYGQDGFGIVKASSVKQFYLPVL
ncbi:hypothetical protein ACP4OV_014483 [Aristida adscensionis]